MKKSLNITAILLLINIMVNAQTPCEQKLKNAKNSIIAIVNSGGSNSKINQTATDVMTNMALNCPESVKEFNKFIQELGKNAKSEEGLDGNVQGNYQTNQERQKGYDEFNRQTNRSFGGQGTNNTGNQNTNNTNPTRTGNSKTGMKGDGYAELPFKDANETTNNNSRNTGSQNTGGRGISGNAIENQRQNEQYKNQAHNQIQNGNGGFKPVENEGDLIAPKLNLDAEIRNFENKLTQVPENLKPDLLAKANFILKTETNKQEATRKLASLMKEFEKNKGGGTLKLSNNSNRKDLEEIETPPQFPGGMEAFGAYLNENLIYPKEAAEKNIEGKVFLSFIIKYDGSIGDIKIRKSAGYGFDEEAVRVLKNSPNWIPATHNGNNVNVEFTIPINFILTK